MAEWRDCLRKASDWSKEHRTASGMARHQLHLFETGRHQLHLFEIMLVERPQLHLLKLGSRSSRELQKGGAQVDPSFHTF